MDNRESIVKMRIDHPCMTLKQIGDEHDLTRERVRQILKSEGLDTKSVRTAIYICNYCGREFIHSLKNPSSFCSRECKSKYSDIDVSCDNCGKIFKRKIYLIIRDIQYYDKQHYFCGKFCFDEWKRKSGFYGNKLSPLGKSGLFASMDWIRKEYGDISGFDFIDVLFSNDIRHVLFRCKNCNKISETNFGKILNVVEDGSDGTLMFCSQDCCYDWRREHNKEWRERWRKT